MGNVSGERNSTGLVWAASILALLCMPIAAWFVMTWARNQKLAEELAREFSAKANEVARVMPAIEEYVQKEAAEAYFQEVRDNASWVKHHGEGAVKYLEHDSRDALPGSVLASIKGGWQWHFFIDPIDPEEDFDKKPLSRSNTTNVVWVDFVIQVQRVPANAPERVEIQIVDHGAKRNSLLLPTVQSLLEQAGIQPRVQVQSCTYHALRGNCSLDH